jgi:1-acyl-sn-glycerol-3-phosphate acyltransferase
LAAPELARRDRLRLLAQREVGRILAPLWVPITASVMRLGFGWRVASLSDTRRAYRRLRRESSSPLLVCANHLTLADSFLIGVALGSPGWYLLHFASLPWNTPERENFARTWWMRALVYVMKCVPVERGGDRREVGQTLARITWLLSRGETALVFPEAGRSRTGRVDTAAASYGVGRIVKSLPGCRVLCVYLRGDAQRTWSDLPARGDRFRVTLAPMEPKTERRGMRGSVEIGRQILAGLAELERRHFDGRQ